MSNLISCVLNEKKKISEMITKIEGSMTDIPEGTLIIDQKKGKVIYYNRLSDTPGARNRKVYIPKENHSLARALAQKDYNARLLKVLVNAENTIDKFLAKFPSRTVQDIYMELDPERRKLVTPVIMTDKQYIEWWLSIPYKGKGFKPSDRTYYTERGEKVRSKSEALIANTLYHAGIPYKYECPLFINGKTIYPDFTILDISTRREVYLEHFGMMDNPEYLASFHKKLEFYEYNGILPGRDLICTFESSLHTLDTRLLIRLIDSYLNPHKNISGY